jgi:hypothetical protein
MTPMVEDLRMIGKATGKISTRRSKGRQGDHGAARGLALVEEVGLDDIDVVLGVRGNKVALHLRR